MSLHPRTSARVEEALWLRESGEAWPVIADRLGCTLVALEISLRRAGHPTTELYRLIGKPRPMNPCPDCGQRKQTRSTRCQRCAFRVRATRPCGTVAAYERHLNHGEVPCDACREANRTKSAEAYRRRKALS